MPEDFENQEPETSDGETEEPVKGPASHIRTVPMNKDNPTMSHRKVKQGMPSKGGAFDDDAPIAGATAGMRSGIGQAAEAGKLLDFVKTYGEYYEAGDPNVLEKQIEQLDSLPSDQASMRIRSINHALGKIHARAREDILDRVSAKMWSQTFPKHKEPELRKFIKLAKKSDKYQQDAIFREKVDRVQESLYSFQDKVKEAAQADPDMKKLDSAYTLVVGGRNAARAYGSALTFTTKGGEAPEKTIAKVHRPMIPITDPGEKEPSRWIPDKNREPEVVPKPFTGVKADPKWAGLAQRSTQSQVADLEKKLSKTKSSADKKELQYQIAKLSKSGGPIIRRKEAIDYYMDRIIEMAVADFNPTWIDEL